MIVFVPGYDDATRVNCVVVAAAQFPPDATLLIGGDARREPLVHWLALHSHESCAVFAMSHGERDRLLCADGTALGADDVALLGDRSVYAYACHTSTALGALVSMHGTIWWGYTGAVSAPVEHPKIVPIFASLFGFIATHLDRACTDAQIDAVIASLHEQCWDAADEIDRLSQQDASIDILGAYYALHHIWDRLRVWSPGADAPRKHPAAAPPDLLI